MPAARTPILPAHIEETVNAIARLHATHREKATPFQRLAARLTDHASRSAFLAWLTILLVGWLALNGVMPLLGHAAWDPPPFGWLQTATSVAALYMTFMILSTQRHEDQLASYREQLTLELAILGDQRSAKIIDLLEQLRRDHPEIVDRIDADAAAMAEPADPQAVLDAIQQSVDKDGSF